MKIVSGKNSKFVEFSDIAVGTVFGIGASIHIKMSPWTDEDDDEINAINLSNNSFESYDPEDEVTPYYDAFLTV